MTKDYTTSSITILAEDTFRGVRTLIVQESPTRKSMFVKTIDDRSSNTFMDIPLPWTIYRLQVSYGGVIPINIVGSPIEITSLSQKAYFLPLPNVYYRWGFISHCQGGRKAINASMSSEEIAAWGIAIAWEGYWQYISPSTDIKLSYDWLTGQNPLQNLPFATRFELSNLYKKWEDLSIADVLEFPWGKVECGILTDLVTY